MSKARTPYEKKQDEKKQAQQKSLQLQNEEIRKNRRESRGGKIKKGGFQALYHSISDLLLSLLGGGDTPGSAQQTLPYERMYKDGMCHVKEDFYSRTIEFFDINYRLSDDETKTNIFDQYCALLNSVSSDVHIQLSFHNQLIDLDELKKEVEISSQDDGLDDVRSGYTEYLKEQLESGRNEMRRTKYLTFTIQAEDVKKARRKLQQVENDLLNQFHSVMKVNAVPLRGYERLRIMQEAMRDNVKDKLFYDFTGQAKSGLTSKDAISPSSFDFRYKDLFCVGARFACASFFQIDASRLYDTALSDFLDSDGELIVSIHLDCIDQEKAIRTVKRTISNIDQMKADQNKKAVAQGIDMDIMPTDINTFGAEARSVLEGLETKDERFFLLTFVVINFADTKAKLESYAAQARSVAQQHNCTLKRLDFQQEQSFQSSLPIGANHIPIKREMLTTNVAGLMPFITTDLFMGRGSLHYGQNPLSQRMILINRKELTSPNGLILGVPGSGKSMAAKMEMAEVRLSTSDSLVVIDVENEYRPLVKKMGGQIVKLSPDSPENINLMDISLNFAEDESASTPISIKAMFLLSVFDKMMDGKMDYLHRSIIDRCIHLVYKPYFENLKPENVPVLGNIYQALNVQPEAEAQTVKTAMEIYVHGSLNMFNHQTNINRKNRIQCYDISALSGLQRDIGLLMMQDNVMNTVAENRAKKEYTWYYCDEFHEMFKTPTSADFAVSSWKRFRKHYAIPTGMTQNVTDFLNNPNSAAIESILSNTPFIRMLEQTHSDAKILSRFLDISSDQMSYVDSPPVGHGLLKCGGTILPFNNRLPKDNVLYPYITTKPGEV